MDLDAIKKSVRLCIDEGQSVSDYADTSMDAVIENSINSAILWCTRHAPLDLLMQSGSGFVQDYTITDSNLTNGATASAPDRLILPTDFIRVARLRRDIWCKGVANPIAEDSDDYLMLVDNTATASINRPVAAYIAGQTPWLELWDGVKHEKTTDLHFSYITSDLTKIKAGAGLSSGSVLETVIMYYAAYLTLIAYGDDRANNMLETAKSYLT